MNPLPAHKRCDIDSVAESAQQNKKEKTGTACGLYQAYHEYKNGLCQKKKAKQRKATHKV
jgi:hypothetical protein